MYGLWSSSDREAATEWRKNPPPSPEEPMPPPRKAELRCDVCNSPAEAVHCKVTCRNCGARRD